MGTIGYDIPIAMHYSDVVTGLSSSNGRKISASGGPTLGSRAVFAWRGKERVEVP
ncbi:hypothetical protein AB0T83_18645 [Fluviibacterium sp. DFM31]|uniref:Uncharacterized protein n=1 Tax=Meridianimarinicoccus marinus TaxID=3231483 RepID=A0ABV3LB44_9RHOB